MFTNKLHELANLYGIQVYYEDVRQKRVKSSDQAIMAILRAMGCPIERSKEAPVLIESFRKSEWNRLCEPVIVVWAGELPRIRVRLNRELIGEKALCRIQYEDRSQAEWNLPLVKLDESTGTLSKQIQYVTRTIDIPAVLPVGYHKLLVKVAWKSSETLFIVAPQTAFSSRNTEQQRHWGVFAPLYALRSAGDWGAGTFGELEKLLTWVAKWGGSTVATLPLLAAFLDEGFDPSPYSPASRLFWNEFYLDVERIPELAGCQEAKKILQSVDFRKQREKAKAGEFVDHRNVASLKRNVLFELSKFFFRSGSTSRKEKFDQFVKDKTQVWDYAEFRAVFEKQKVSWYSWPSRMAQGSLRENDYDREIKDYHLYVQWLADEQLASVAKTAGKNDLGLFLDLPLGVSPDSFDVWRYRNAFVLDARVGAPPDRVFTRGQDWGFPPIHPGAIRERFYDYFIACIRHHLKFGRVLRVDHVMGLHRLFWIPKGFEAKDGVYVHYPNEELYAILCLESHRAGSVIVGENLGIVPAEVNKSMRKHNIQELFVLQYELPTTAMKDIREIPDDAVASLNTHDMPPFRAYWDGLDIPVRVKLGILNERNAQNESRVREGLHSSLIKILRCKGWLAEDQTDYDQVLKACMTLLGSSQAPLVVVGLEDLWSERHPQNIPSTCAEYPNWRRKMKYTLEEFFDLTVVLELLKHMEQIRKSARVMK
ncbi:MAG: 4-alpha-glucanotransferase [Candidatus Omnitrophica bacterium]|nr:4-alpha-glucanotransferase [Candidatus Omnitrophota bacterium]